MFRLTACFAASLTLIAAQASANEDCVVFGEIAQKAVAERQGEAEMMDAMVTIAEGYTGEQQRFAGAVPLLVDWVWKLPEDQLGDDVGLAYQTACETSATE